VRRLPSSGAATVTTTWATPRRPAVHPAGTAPRPNGRAPPRAWRRGSALAL